MPKFILSFGGKKYSMTAQTFLDARDDFYKKMDFNKTTIRSIELKLLLKYIDRVLSKVLVVYNMGARCSVYFPNINEDYTIDAGMSEKVFGELQKRDNGRPQLNFYKGELESVKIMAPFG